ncbi:hypothetical protein BO94DRAFT_530304 [Aspergillus sclerotioniger CBS 115572]|uniref:Uncharacterized protein n=1 Tax=Aspergillus sclerotioniger CBS 115572 TaxID=1450535 RepID=A0A317XAG3_9EURO|nr:hypothetical protein BO94DRAFT_530304 [Aspergillus sclerotioniger CBS 115572]PWY95576.1 hypothetical protein BO94DRAFT_530304 [Aspergillus sclerotioniger CBS 115572]
MYAVIILGHPSYIAVVPSTGRVVSVSLRFRAYCNSTYVVPSPTQSHGEADRLIETSKAFRGTFYSPFMRAYSSALAEAGITMKDFLPFIDGLNDQPPPPSDQDNW